MLSQPTGQKLSNVRRQQKKISIGPILYLYYEESLVSSNLNSKQLRFYCAHPNRSIWSSILRYHKYSLLILLWNYYKRIYMKRGFLFGHRYTGIPLRHNELKWFFKDHSYFYNFNIYKHILKVFRYTKILKRYFRYYLSPLCTQHTACIGF